MSSSGQDRGKNISRGAIPPPGLNVLKRDGSVQPFDKNKLLNSIKSAGATREQASLVSDRVIGRLGGFKQTVPSSQLSTMVARSLSKVNPAASGQYTSSRDQKLRSPLAPAAKGAARTIGASIKTPVPLIQKPKAPLPKVSISTAVPPQQKPAVSRVGAVTDTVPLQKILELIKQSTSRISTSFTVPLQQKPESEKPEKEQPELWALLCDASGTAVAGNGVYAEINVSPDAEYTFLVVAATLVGRNGGGVQRRQMMEKNGLLTYKCNYFEPNGTWPNEYTTLEALEKGNCAPIFRFYLPGVYEFAVTWPGDENTLPATSNGVKISANFPVRNCAKCGASMPANAAYCPNCGQANQ